MRTIILIVLSASTGIFGNAQTTRYFEFTTSCGSGKWQDTSFIASVSDPIVIDTVLANLARPAGQRNFISGPIDYGNGGFNHNADHWFLWHFKKDQWDLAESAIELCDGCPYSDIDSDTAYWIGQIGFYCPWSGIPVREVSDPTGVDHLQDMDLDIQVYPNPVRDILRIRMKDVHATPVFLVIYNSLGQSVYSTNIKQPAEVVELDISGIDPGIYFTGVLFENSAGIMKKIIIGK